MECLVTKLLERVNNDNLPIFEDLLYSGDLQKLDNNNYSVDVGGLSVGDVLVVEISSNYSISSAVQLDLYVRGVNGLISNRADLKGLDMLETHSFQLTINTASDNAAVRVYAAQQYNEVVFHVKVTKKIV